jgi:hypothetical protein
LFSFQILARLISNGGLRLKSGLNVDARTYPEFDYFYFKP